MKWRVHIEIRLEDKKVGEWIKDVDVDFIPQKKMNLDFDEEGFLTEIDYYCYSLPKNCFHVFIKDDSVSGSFEQINDWLCKSGWRIPTMED